MFAETPTSLLKFQEQLHLLYGSDGLEGGDYTPRQQNQYHQPSRPVSTRGDKTDEPKNRLNVIPASSQLAEITRAILPNKFFNDGSGNATFERAVSTTLCGRRDVEELERGLEEALQNCQVRPKPVCSVRARIYSECFDELVSHPIS